MATLTKAEIARRQLGSALALYLEDRDPVSVHCLACGGCEIAEQLAINAGAPPFRSFTLAANPKMTDRDFQGLRNQYWNAFKHSTKRGGGERADNLLLEEFSERANEERLFVGWSDYSIATSSLPIEAQVFNTWFLALDFSKFAPDVDHSFLVQLHNEFPDLASLPHDRQKKRLLRAIDKYRKVSRKSDDPSTDRRPLVLGSI